MEFLRQVARHYFNKGGISETCFIFPSRRALTFFRKYLCEEVAAAHRTIICPQMYTMNDFFYRLSGVRATDRVLLLTTLYDCYSSLYKGAESIDDFIFWGDVLLSDFNDVDKYLADPSELFRNIEDYRKMQDSLDYLSPNQKEAMERFLGHFRNDKEYKDRFRRIWDILYPLYVNFNETLLAKGMSYEGMVYRSLASGLSQKSVSELTEPSFKSTEKFVFVGLNALNECERLLLRKMRDAGLAQFCWDYSSSFIKNGMNRSSFFLQKNVNEFPQAFEIDQEGLPNTQFNLLSVSSAVAQAKRLPWIFSRLGTAAKPSDTAVVIPDEGLLLSALSSIPSGIKDINVTMGYPVAGSQMWSLVSGLSALQMHIRLKDGRAHFHWTQVNSILSNSLVASLLSDGGKEAAGKFRTSRKYYVCEDDLRGDELLESIFRGVVTDAADTSPVQVKAIIGYLKSVLSLIGRRLPERPEMSCELDFARQYYLTVERLGKDIRPMLPATFFRLLGQMSSGASVPFKGEPLKGLQIMGPLETRAVDFKNLVILSCNEGTFPRRSVSASFIPPELRKGFSLPTYEYQDAVWAYYFYRMIQRAENVWLVYDSRTEGLRGGETSRFIKQLQLHFGVSFKKYVAVAGCSNASEQKDIAKTPQMISRLDKIHLSASSLQNYLDCPARFYYGKVEGLKAEDKVNDSLDGGQLGSVLHEVMHQLYDTPSGKVSAEYLGTLVSDEDPIREKVRAEILRTLKCFEISGRNIIFEDMIVRYVRQIVRRDLELLRSRGKDHLSVLGLEKDAYLDLEGFKFIGFIDRLDTLDGNVVRIVDYKTGKVKDDDFIINPENAGDVVEKLFDGPSDKRPKIALQLYIYDLMAQRLPQTRGKALVNSIYHTGRLFVNGVEEIPLCGEFCSLMDERLRGLLREIRDESVPFSRCENESTCKDCDFKQICGR